EAQVYPIIDHWGWRSQSRILNLARRAAADVLNIQYQAAAYALHPAINLLPLHRHLAGPRLPVVVTFHDLKVPYLFPKAGRLRNEVVLGLARTADAVIVTNEEDWARLSQILHPSKLHLIPIGSNIDPQPPPDYNRAVWRARLGISPDQTVLTYFGFLNVTKGGEDLIRALNLLIRQGVNARLMMIGGRVGASDPTNLAYLRRVEALIVALGLENRVSWTDHLPAPEVSAHLLASDLAVLPYRDGASYRRGTLMAVLAHGLPVVTTTPTSGGWAARLPPLVDGENVRLVPAENPETLAAAIAGLVADPELRQHLSSGAVRLAQAFGWESIARQTLSVYQSIQTPEVSETSGV
ncbi:MAG: hypothetical protein A2Z04_00925, partial [Chloroflexi bacterium RBG_16_57_9]